MSNNVIWICANTCASVVVIIVLLHLPPMGEGIKMNQRDCKWVECASVLPLLTHTYTCVKYHLQTKHTHSIHHSLFRFDFHFIPSQPLSLSDSLWLSVALSSPFQHQMNLCMKGSSDLIESKYLANDFQVQYTMYNHNNKVIHVYIYIMLKPF